ncbi:MAG: ABC transporter ATP-binding protein, partial [Planktothrix sp.]
MNKFDTQLWQRFLRIAQPFFYPVEPGSGKIFLSLLLLLLIFLAATVFVLVSIVTVISQSIFPEFFNSIAPGLYELIASIIYSRYIIIVILMLIVPIGTFLVYRNPIKTRWQPWAFLSVLLFLSLSVSGLNIIISYVGNFFTTALAERNQDDFWRFLYVYASVFVVGTPIIVIYYYTRDRLGNYWRKWLTDKFLDQYLSQRAFYQIESENKLDNPDQRITEDIKAFTITSLRFLLIILSSIIDVISFTGILWSISKFLSVFLLIYASVGT